MRLGIVLPIDAGEPAGDIVSQGARAAEEHGLDSVWFFDSIGRGRMSLDPLIGASVAAAATERIEVGIGILQVPLRHPVELAQRVLTAQLLCEGRLLLGVGSGSTRGDFEAVQQNFDDRMALLENGLATMQRLWDGETVEGVHLAPSDAVKGGPPVLIGSWAGPSLDRRGGQGVRRLDRVRLLLRVRHPQQRHRTLPGGRGPARHRYEHIAGPRGANVTDGGLGQRVPSAVRPRGSVRAAAEAGGCGFRRRGCRPPWLRRGRPRGHPRSPPVMIQLVTAVSCLNPALVCMNSANLHKEHAENGDDCSRMGIV